MRKLKRSGIFAVLALALILTACAGSQNDRESDSSKMGENGTENSSVDQSESNRQEDSQTENSTGEESELQSQKTTELEQGWVKLSEDELEWFNEQFFNVDGKSIVNAFLNCAYEDIKNISLVELFYDGEQPSVAISDEEMVQLKGSSIDHETDFQKVATSYMDKMLRTYADISFEETNKVDIENFLYLKEYDAYYLSHGDTHYFPVTITAGIMDKDGTVKLQYVNDLNEKFEVTLRAHDKGYYFVSNIAVE